MGIYLCGERRMQNATSVGEVYINVQNFTVKLMAREAVRGMLDCYLFGSLLGRMFDFLFYRLISRYVKIAHKQRKIKSMHYKEQKALRIARRKFSLLLFFCSSLCPSFSGCQSLKVLKRHKRIDSTLSPTPPPASASSPAPSPITLRKILPRDGDVFVSPFCQLGAAIQEIVTEYAPFNLGLAACKKRIEKEFKERGGERGGGEWRKKDDKQDGIHGHMTYQGVNAKNLAAYEKV